MSEKLPPWASEEDYKKVEEWYKDKEVGGKTCAGCLYEGRNNGACGLVSALCVNSPSKPYFKKKSAEAIYMT